MRAFVAATAAVAVVACGGCASSGTHTSTDTGATTSATDTPLTYTSADALLAAVERAGVPCGRRVDHEPLRPGTDGIACEVPGNDHHLVTVWASIYADGMDVTTATATLADNVTWEHDNPPKMTYREAYQAESWLAGPNWVVTVSNYAVPDPLAEVKRLQAIVGGVPNLGGPAFTKMMAGWGS